MLKHLPRFGCCANNRRTPLSNLCATVSFLRNKGNAGGNEERKVRECASGRVFHLSLHRIRAGSTHRAWQELPRHLRRRAASHNVRRVPLRLRPKSRLEVSDVYIYIYLYIFLILSKMDSRRRKILGRSLPKLGKSRRERRSDTFKRRQSE